MNTQEQEIEKNLKKIDEGIKAAQEYIDQEPARHNAFLDKIKGKIEKKFLKKARILDYADRNEFDESLDIILQILDAERK